MTIAAKAPRRLAALAACSSLLVGTAVATAAGPKGAYRGPLAWDRQASQDTLHIPGQQDDTEAEPAIAVNPTDRDNVVTTFQMALHLGGATLGFATSLDGGRTWRDGYLPGTHVTGGTFDAAVDATAAFGPDGTAYATGDLNDFGLGAAVPSEIGLWTSHDHGRSWSQPVPVVKQTTQFNANGDPYSIPDASNIVVDQLHAAGHHFGRLYVTWDHNGGQAPDVGVLSAAYSDDGGRTWNLGPTGQGYPIDAQTGMSGVTVPLVMPNGDLAVVISGDQALAQSGASHARIAIAPGAGSIATGQPLLFTRQYPIGVTLGDPFSGYANARQNFTAPYVQAAVDPRNGRLYAVWADSRFRTDLGVCDIVIASSVDGGQTWSAPRRVDPGPTNDDVDRYLPSVGVTPDGSVQVSYRQQQDGSVPDGSQDSRFVDTIYQVSHDGGQSFTRPLRVNSSSTDLGFAVAKPLPGGPLSWLGDYEQLAVAPGRVYLVRAEALDLHLSGESSQLPAKWHHQRIYVAALHVR